MKKLLAAVSALLFVFPLTAKDLGVRTQAKIEITTNTSYGFSLDDPDQQGLKMDFSHFNIQFGLANGGLISNKIKSDDPTGFMQFEFGGLQLNWGNTGALFDKDMNNPGKNTKVGFNDGDKGYTYPIYIERFVSGIQWRAFDTDMMVQLAAGGDAPENWRPWSNPQRGYITSEFLQRWAFLDARVQHQRGPIPNLYLDDDRGGKMNSVGLLDDGHYWSHGNANDPAGLPQNLALNPQGTLVGYQVAGTDFAAMLKFVTEKTWADIPEKNGGKNGMAFGIDTAYSPSEWKALKAYASAGKVINYGPDSRPQPLGFGGKLGVDLPVAEGLSLEPYVGYQGIRWDKIGSLQVGTDVTYEYRNANEASAGLTLHWPGNGGWQWDPLEQRNGVSFPGLTVAYSVRDNNAQYYSDSNSETETHQVIGSHPIHNLLVTLFEESGDYGLIPGVGASMSIQYLDFLNLTSNTIEDFQAATANGKLLATTYLDYTLVDVIPGELVPWTRVYYDRLTDRQGDWVQNVKVDAGVKLSKAIRNTVLGLTYESRNLTGLGKSEGDTSSTDPYHGYYGLGLLKAWVEVSL